MKNESRQIGAVCENLCPSGARWSVPAFSRVSRISRSKIPGYSRLFSGILAYSRISRKWGATRPSQSGSNQVKAIHEKAEL